MPRPPPPDSGDSVRENAADTRRYVLEDRLLVPPGLWNTDHLGQIRTDGTVAGSIVDAQAAN